MNTFNVPILAKNCVNNCHHQHHISSFMNPHKTANRILMMFQKIYEVTFDKHLLRTPKNTRQTRKLIVGQRLFPVIFMRACEC